jgi:hypothetical protein
VESPLPAPGAYLYWIEAIGLDGSGSRWLEPVLVVIEEWTGGGVSVFPNLGLAEAGQVSLRLYDAAGRALGEERTFVGARGRQEWAVDLAELSGRRPSAGIYYLRIENGERRDVKRVVLLRTSR